MEVSGQHHAPAALPPGKEPPGRLCGPQNQSGRYGEENLSRAGNGTKNPRLY